MLFLQEYDGIEHIPINKVTISKWQSKQCHDFPHHNIPKGHRISEAQSSADWNLRNSHILSTSEPSLIKHYSHHPTNDKDELRPVTKKLAAKLSSMIAIQNKGKIPKNSFVAKLQSAADRNLNHKKNKNKLVVMLEFKGPYPVTEEMVKTLQKMTTKMNDGKIPKNSEAALAQSALARQKEIKKFEDRKAASSRGKLLI